MLPLLPQVGLRADHTSLPLEERRPVRRGAPQALRFDAAAPGWPPLRIDPVPPPVPARQGGGWGWLAALWRGRAPGAAPAR